MNSLSLNKNGYRLSAASVLFLAAVIFQIESASVFVFKLDFVLVTLVALAFFLNFHEILFLDLVAVFLLNWQPILSWEMGVLFLLPLAANWSRRWMPGRLWFTSLFFIIMSAVVFYSVASFSLFFQNLGGASRIVFSDLVFGEMIFLLFNYFFGFQDYV